jgi:hypothetical protein
MPTRRLLDREETMRVTIQPTLNQLRYEELIVECSPGTLPAPAASERAIAVIKWDGQRGSIEYVSRAPGFTDIEFFADPAVLKPYLAAFRQQAVDSFDAETAKLDEVTAALAATVDVSSAPEPPIVSGPTP